MARSSYLDHESSCRDHLSGVEYYMFAEGSWGLGFQKQSNYLMSLLYRMTLNFVWDICKGVRWSIGDGMSAWFWLDKWLRNSITLVDVTIGVAMESVFLIVSQQLSFELLFACRRE
ncbi:RNA-directed DNA polymerase (reversetranscriptase)-related family protein [Striga asiatica]|uniref:RNA-directed DNA polymerase (Reversetranscriptase)-related family protein n=1 Tax=Striga asiatica TaxID=4170 RepID=A0A5A7PI42_STRAF|nr:RNA-directed DNA polymerase (reversetranscriptase)-related family protein [Striga asiatica]